MQVSTIWRGKKFFQATGPTGYTINMDATSAWGGEGNGASPVEVLLGSLAGCIGIDVTMILENFLPSIKSLEIITDGVRREEAPKGFATIELTFKVEGDIPDYRIWRAIEMGTEKYCSVSDSLNAVITHKLVLNGVEMKKGIISKYEVRSIDNMRNLKTSSWGLYTLGGVFLDPLPYTKPNRYGERLANDFKFHIGFILGMLNKIIK